MLKTVILRCKLCGMALSFVAIGTIVRLLVLPQLKLAAPYLTFYPAVMLAATFGGFWSGLVAAIFSAVLASYFWIEPVGYFFKTTSQADNLGIIIFLVNCTLISCICEIMLRARNKVRVQAADLRELNIKLGEQTCKLQEINAALEEEVMERAKAEEYSRKQAELMDLSYDYILVRDPDSRIIYWNRGAEIGYGVAAGEAMGQVTHSLLQTAFPEPLNNITNTLESKGRWEGELIHTRKDGGKIVVRSHQVLRRDASGLPEAILEINQDITVQKHAEAELRELNAELEDKVEERTRDLQKINAALQEEILERKAAQEQLLNHRNSLVMSEARYRGLALREYGACF